MIALSDQTHGRRDEGEHVDLGLRGRRAAVAASSKGLGFGAAAALVAEGVQVVVCGRDKDRVDEAVRRLGAGAVGLVADVSTAEGGAAFVRDAAERLGGAIEILVPNAGGPPAGTFASTPLDQYPVALQLNLLSVVGMCTAAVPAMQSAGWGRIVAITSVAVRQPIANLILSNTARAGVTGFLKTLALEVASDGITVNTLQPGLHATDRIRTLYGDGADAAAGIPAGTIGDPGDFGSFVAYLCSEQAKFVTGANIPVDGGAYAGLL
jgi:3-oxoacyl-[acyl-carrier protein] reductase